jgi:hypothetical protein
MGAHRPHRWRLHAHVPAFLLVQCAAAFIPLPLHPISTSAPLRCVLPQAFGRPGIRCAAAAGALCASWKPLPAETEKAPTSTAIIGGGPAGPLLA